MAKQISLEEAIQLAEDHLSEGRYKEASEIAGSILSKVPNSPQGLSLKGRLAEAEGNPDDALHYLVRSALIAPEDSATYNHIGRVSLGHISFKTEDIRGLICKTKDLIKEDHQKTIRHSEMMYRQSEALTQLVHSIKPRIPFPPFRGWAISPDFGNLIIKHFHIRRPSRVFDLGSGNSTLICSYLLEQQGDGTVYSVDHDEQFVSETSSNIKAHLLDNVDLRHAPLTRYEIDGSEWQWYDTEVLCDINEIDMVIIDGPPGYLQKRSRLPCVDFLKKRLSADCHILVDDANREDEKYLVQQFSSLLSNTHEAKSYPSTEKGACVIAPKAK